ncbi:hypothetical protein BAUCODRAFT_144415 [Baudoinia panamericana UAMH 10762]|uniref:Uncharacterized protein n=1 Tax=Baudoinia panamericana (strain UAMH 10762) TaxID=717646 RepID=M2NMP5_BAUPA|nr:uncharacterized protein BAUCODRAFT_144415 [Baudoinia panamericana UAMH 10762]EMD00805.1 hypothetical protein BAUCODRAFT_144415 [Baudoinia panamericana UAMH 10762]
MASLRSTVSTGCTPNARMDRQNAISRSSSAASSQGDSQTRSSLLSPTQRGPHDASLSGPRPLDNCPSPRSSVATPAGEDVPSLEDDNSISGSDSASMRTDAASLPTAGTLDEAGNVPLQRAYTSNVRQTLNAQRLALHNHLANADIDGDIDPFEHYSMSKMVGASDDPWSVPKMLFGESRVSHNAHLASWLADVDRLFT